MGGYGLPCQYYASPVDAQNWSGGEIETQPPSDPLGDLREPNNPRDEIALPSGSGDAGRNSELEERTK